MQVAQSGLDLRPKAAKTVCELSFLSGRLSAMIYLYIYIYLSIIIRQMPGLCPKPQPRQATHHHHHHHRRDHQTLVEDLQGM